MPEGIEYVLVTYGLAAATLGVWFWMILAKLRRLDAQRAAATTDREGA